MQQRFCTCGNSIWVHYILPNSDCRVVFRRFRRLIGSRLRSCPVCGRELSIDELR